MFQHGNSWRRIVNPDLAVSLDYYESTIQMSEVRRGNAGGVYHRMR